MLSPIVWWEADFYNFLIGHNLIVRTSKHWLYKITVQN